MIIGKGIPGTFRHNHLPMGGQHDFRMDNAAFPGVVVGHAVPFICQLGSAAVSSCGNSGTARAALDDTDGDMTEIYGEHLLSVRG